MKIRVMIKDLKEMKSFCKYLFPKTPACSLCPVYGLCEQISDIIDNLPIPAEWNKEQIKEIKNKLANNVKLLQSLSESEGQEERWIK